VPPFMIVSMVNATSPLLKGLPSCQVTPLRSVNVRTLPSAERSHFSASTGTGSVRASSPTRPSKSKGWAASNAAE
jgi:hypothetical protein